MDDVVAKRIKNDLKRITLCWSIWDQKRFEINNFMLINMEAETNEACTVKKESGDNEEAREIENSGNKVGT